MDFAADLSDSRFFYTFPFPSDLRLTAEGTPDLRGFPNQQQVALVEGLRQTAALHRGFTVMPVGYFAFTAPVAARAEADVVPASPDAPLLLVDVDAESPERGRLLPVVAHTPQPDDYVPEHLLSVAPRPGVILRPNTTYAFVVRRQLQDASGALLGVPLSLEQLKTGAAPAGPLGTPAVMLYAPLWDALGVAGVDRADVAAATVFTTGDVVADLARITDGLMTRHAVTVDNLRLHPVMGTRDEGFCTLAGTVTQPQFQLGTPPFNSQGLFAFGADGLPTQQGTMTVPVVFTLPRRTMPDGGFPLVLYVHGSGGTSDEAVNAGPTLVVGGPSQEGTGPAFTVAQYGMGTACSAMPVNPERLPGASDFEYLNLNNPSALRDTFRQGVIEQRLFLEALRTLRIPASALAGCTGISPAQGTQEYRFSEENLVVMGQSMGGWYTNMISAVEPRVKVAVPTGAGGYLTYFVLRTQAMENVAGGLQILLGTLQPLTFMHPGLHLLDLGCEAADPLVHLPRISRRPLPGHAPRDIYEPVGLGDRYFETVVFDAMALGYGNQQAGAQVWPSMQQALALEDRDGLAAYPIQHNRMSESGAPYTGVVVQYEGDGIANAHAIYRQLPAVKSQVGCFLDTFLRTGTATVVEPQTPGSPCMP